MRYFLFFSFILCLLTSSCNNKDEIESSIWNHQKEIIEFDEKLMRKGEKLIFKTPLIVPIHILTSDSSLILYDYSGGSIKQFYFNQKERSFNPIKDGPFRIEGNYFKGVGIDDFNNDILFVETNESISAFNFSKNDYNRELVDKFQHCPSFNSPFHEIFTLERSNKLIIISQNGIPCYNVSNLGNEVTLKNFKEKQFVRIVSNRNGEVNYSLQLPDIPINNLYERFRLYLTFNQTNNKFYAMLNPLDFLFEFELDFSKLSFNLIDFWDLNLKYSELPIDHFIQENIDNNVVMRSLDFNFEINFIDSNDKYFLVSYTPSKDLIYDNPKDAPYSSHYLLSILDLKSKEIKTFSLNYNEFQFYGLSNNKLWIYDVVESENSGDTIFKLLNIEMI